LIPAAVFLALLFLSCPVEVEEEGTEGAVLGAGGTVLGTRDFWAVDMRTGKYYQTRADLLAEGQYCKIWVEQDSRERTGSAVAQAVARDYDENIYPKMRDHFGLQFTEKDQNGLVISRKNTLELADWLADRDGKLSILLLDIKDGYNSSVSGSYTAGYFSSANFYQQSNSNLADMIYVDTYPGEPGKPGGNVTLAHETQHLMNFITSSQLRRNDSATYPMETWIDEGLSSAAEYIYLGDHPKDRYLWFNKDPKGTIARGNNFFVWGNYQDDSKLDDYATVYLFFQWLRLQSGGTGIYKNIMTSPYSDYHAVAGAADKSMPGNGYAGWDTLLKTWMAANYIKAPSGKYGYQNDGGLNEVQAKIAPGGITALQLLPGEGVYSIAGKELTSYYNAGSGPNIKYAGLVKPAGIVDDKSPYLGGVLLTYNANTDPKGTRETGRLTGLADMSGSGSGGVLSSQRSVAGTTWEGPVRIDARDMLARNGRREEGEGFVPDAFLPGDWILEGHGE
jgi:hypothetical protein